MTIIKQEKRTAGRPSKMEKELKKRGRVPVGGFRDKLTVKNTDPNFYYRWVLDIDATGARVLEFLQADYVFVEPKEVIVGEAYVFSSPDYGDIIRRPGNKHGDYHYLMKLPKELREADVKAKQDHVDQIEEALSNPTSMDGEHYGKLKITN